jgi:beta-lysine 5,6-aminomutase beta subunit
MLQMSFPLPVASGPLAEAAALGLAEAMGVRATSVAHQKAIGPSFTFFVIYGRCRHTVDLRKVHVVEREFPLLDPEDINRRVRSLLRRRLTIVGACTGSDAHTVGIDAILNVKGFAGNKGLEYYRGMRVVNLGAQVTPDALRRAAIRERADTVLVSQVVTQRDVHLQNLSAVASVFGPPGPKRPLLIAGGPRLTADLASRFGFDRVFGRGTTPQEVASYLVWAIAQRHGGPRKPEGRK